MFWMHTRTRSGRVRAAILVFTGIVFSFSSSASALSLAAVEELALSSDPGVQSVRASRPGRAAVHGGPSRSADHHPAGCSPHRLERVSDEESIDAADIRGEN